MSTKLGTNIGTTTGVNAAGVSPTVVEPSGAPRGKIPPGPNFGKRGKIGGQLGAVRRDPLAFFTHCAHTYGDVTAIRYFNFRSLIHKQSGIHRRRVGEQRAEIS